MSRCRNTAIKLLNAQSTISNLKSLCALFLPFLILTVGDYFVTLAVHLFVSLKEIEEVGIKCHKIDPMHSYKLFCILFSRSYYRVHSFILNIKEVLHINLECVKKRDSKLTHILKPLRSKILSFVDVQWQLRSLRKHILRGQG